MNLKRAFFNSAKVCIGGISILSTFYTVVRLMVFLSDPQYKLRQPPGSSWVDISWKLLINTALLSLFICHHTLFALPIVKKWFGQWNLRDCQRSIYIITTCLILQIMMSYWLSITEWTIWNWNTKSRVLYWSFFTVQAVAWVVIYVGNICMDLNELLGTKQIYYSIKNLPHPNSLKSKSLLRLYEHMRHPSATAFLVIFWIIPIMTLDRLLLAVMLSSYMFIAWKTDLEDYHYQKVQYQKKFQHYHYN